MAVAQRQIVPPYQRTLVLPRPRVQLRSSARGRDLQIQASLTSGLVAVALLVSYVYGYARMTSANYQRCEIQQVLHKLRIQEQILNSTALELGSKDRIETWARANNMAPASGVPVVIRPPEGR